MDGYFWQMLVAILSVVGLVCATWLQDRDRGRAVDEDKTKRRKALAELRLELDSLQLTSDKLVEAGLALEARVDKMATELEAVTAVLPTLARSGTVAKPD